MTTRFEQCHQKDEQFTVGRFQSNLESINTSTDNGLVRSINKASANLPGDFPSLSIFDGDSPGRSSGMSDCNHSVSHRNRDTVEPDLTNPNYRGGVGHAVDTSESHQDVVSIGPDGSRQRRDGISKGGSDNPGAADDLSGGKSEASNGRGRQLVNADFSSLNGMKIQGNVPRLMYGDAAHPEIARFAIDRNNSAHTYRSAINYSTPDQRLQYGGTYDIKFSTRMVDWPDDRSADTFFTLHPQPANGWENAPRSANNSVKIGTRNGDYYFFDGKQSYNLGPVAEMNWNDWEIKMRVDGGTNAPGQQGFVDLYQNGKRIVHSTGVNTDANLGGQPMVPNLYSNVGLYKWDWRPGRPQTDSNRRVVDFANFSINQV